jgi:hypothetical protein
MSPEPSVFSLGANAGELEVIELAARAAEDSERVVAAGLDDHGIIGGAGALGTDGDPPRAGRESLGKVAELL